MKKFLKVVGLLVIAAVIYLLIWPIPVDPKSWTAPENKGYVGDFAPNTRMANVQRVDIGEVGGPEDAVIGPDGRVYTATHSGKVMAVDLKTLKFSVFADTGGRSLGMEFGSDGSLYVADAFRGVVKISKDGKTVDLLTDKDETGKKIGLADDLDVTKDGVVYFSDATTKFPGKGVGDTYSSSLLDLMEHGLYGRILKYDPVSKKTTVVVKDLSFANGVALARDESYLLFLETGTYSVHKLWLTGEKKGKTETILQNLPGFPDNINRANDGTFWLGLVSPRSGALDKMAGMPFVRKIVQRLPAFMRPKAQRYGFVIHIDGNGKVIETIQDPSGSYALTTGAIDGPDGSLIITSLGEKTLGWLKK